MNSVTINRTAQIYASKEAAVSTASRIGGEVEVVELKVFGAQKPLAWIVMSRNKSCPLCGAYTEKQD